MKTRHKIFSSLLCIAIAAIGIFLSGTVINLPNSQAATKAITQGEGKQDKRKTTSIQNSTVAIGKITKAVQILYLNLPWGEKTFSYLEEGGSDYYSTRTWPMAHLKLAVAANYEGHALKPGNYMFIITPVNANDSHEMTISLASFRATAKNPTFLVPGDVFTDTPEEIVEISKKPVTFAKGAPLADHLQIDLEKAAGSKEVNVNIHYGDRTLTEKLTLN